MPPDPRVLVGVCVLVERDDRLLMIQRGGSATPGGPVFAVDGIGTYSVPGGWLEHGETPEQAAVRETIEETGVIVEPLAQAGWGHGYRLVGDKESIVTLHVRCRWVAGEPVVMEPDKCPWVGWVQVDRVPTLLLFAPLAEYWRGRVAHAS